MLAAGISSQGEAGSGSSPVFRWLRELAGLVPGTSSMRQRARLILLKTDAGLEAHVSLKKAPLQLGVMQPDDTPASVAQLKAAIQNFRRARAHAVLRLSPGHVLQRKLKFPKAARDVLGAVIANQMDQIAPWPADETVFGYVIVDDASEDGQITVDVVATSRAIMDEALEEARRLDVEPSVIDYAAEAGAPLGIVLQADESGKVRLAKRIGFLLALLTIAAVGVGGYGVYDLLGHRTVLMSAQAELGEKRAKLAELRKRQAESIRLNREADKLARKKAGQPAVMIALEALSRAVPDSAWLTNLEVRGDELRLTGKASNASGLIATLEKVPHFEDVQFSEPTTQSEKGAKEDFSITAKIVATLKLDDKR